MPDLVAISRSLRRAVDALEFVGDVSHVYNPLAYAWKPHRRYLETYGRSRKSIVLVGMNPGPFGMAQTGVPFGEIDHVRDWLGIDAPVDRPDPEHPKRPIQGFDCPRSEVSGRRLWGWARERFGTPTRFFDRFFVHNYCPLVFMAASGRNITPDKLPADERAPLFAACDRALTQVVDTLAPELVVGVGAFAERRASAVLADRGVAIGRLPHPSPASPLANRGWSEVADAAFEALEVRIP